MNFLKKIHTNIEFEQMLNWTKLVHLTVRNFGQIFVLIWLHGYCSIQYAKAHKNYVRIVLENLIKDLKQLESIRINTCLVITCVIDWIQQATIEKVFNKQLNQQAFKNIQLKIDIDEWLIENEARKVCLVVIWYQAKDTWIWVELEQQQQQQQQKLIKKSSAE